MDAKFTASIALSCCLSLGIGFAGGWMLRGSGEDQQTVAMEAKTSADENGNSNRVEKRLKTPLNKADFMEYRRRKFEGREDSQRGRRRGPPRERIRRNQPAEDPSAIYKIALGNAPVTGAANAKVTIVEISDYECPFCSRGNDTMNELLKKYEGVLRIAMKQNPLPMHANARSAATAALAAGEQGKYWEMHEKLFEATSARTPLTMDKIEEISTEIGLNVEAVKSAIESDKYAAQINADQKQASNLGLRGTPAFFINGRKIVGARKAEAFSAVIDEELKRADAALAAGAPADANGLYEYLIRDGADKPVFLPGQENINREPPPNPFMGTGPARDISIPATSPSIGPADASVTLVEFLDFQCGHCKKASGDIQRLLKEYPADLRIVFRHQPLVGLHAQAREAALASMAAAKQGKFWEMERKLFENNDALSEEKIESLAGEIGLDLNAFREDWKSEGTAALVDADMADAKKLGITGTPTMFINGRTLIGARPYESLKKLIDDEISKLKEGK